jgi:hypothetical protein
MIIGINVRMEKCSCKRGISGDKNYENSRLNGEEKRREQEQREKVGE